MQGLVAAGSHRWDAGSQVAETARIALVHLVRKQNGLAPLSAFVEAYTRTTRDTDHELVLALKGFDGPAEVGVARPAWSSIPVRELLLPDVGLDLGSYRRAAVGLENDFVCFLNSFSRPLVPGWLTLLLTAAEPATVGMVGCTASWESMFDAAREEATMVGRRRFVRRLLPTGGVPRGIRNFDRFPNPHLRTNAFCLRTELMRSLEIPDPRTKIDAYKLESGPWSLTRQVLARGLDVSVVASDGLSYGLDSIRASRTFRAGDQDQLLVADNATDNYATAAPELRAKLQRFAWGASQANDE